MSINLAVFASGKGSNAKNIFSYFSTSSKICVALFCTNSLSSGVVDLSKQKNVPLFVFNKKDLDDFSVVHERLVLHKIHFIVLAGFLLKIPKSLILCYPKKIINLHPSLLPKHGGQGMYGKYVHQSVIEAKEKESGISVHFVNSEYDKGVIVFQKTCVVDKNETASSLEKKIRVLELSFFPKVIEEICLSL